MAPGNPISEVDASLSTRGLMQRKLYLMKMMLKNEQKANGMMKRKIEDLSQEFHQNHPTLKALEKSYN